MDAPIDRDALKRAAAETAVALVTDGMVVGLGTGSTAAFAIEALIRRVREERLNILGIPTSRASEAQARAGGLKLTDFANHRRLDITIDGADEVSLGALDLIKGAGGALLREKIVAAASDRLVIIADDSKLVDRLGSQVKLPVEVVAFGWQVTADRIRALGGDPTLRVGRDGEPFRTDGGDLILDCRFAPIADPADLEGKLTRTIGVIESGLFVGMADLVLIACPGSVRRLERAS